MNFGGQSMAQSMAVMSAIEQEIEAMSEIYQSVTNACHEKCIPPTYHYGNLNKGESVCTDRCVFKYMDTFFRVTKQLNAIRQQQMEQIQAAASTESQ